MDELEDLEVASPAVLHHVRRSLQFELDQEPEPVSGGYAQTRRDVLRAQSMELNRMYTAGEVSEETRRRLQRHLDRQDLRFTDE